MHTPTCIPAAGSIPRARAHTAERMHVTSAFGLGAERMDVSVETAVCHTLLGDLDASLDALNLTSGAAGEPDADVLEFVNQATGGEGGPEAGACALVERWVRKVLTAEMPDFYKGRTFTLEYWGMLPEVRCPPAVHHMLTPILFCTQPHVGRCGKFMYSTIPIPGGNSNFDSPFVHHTYPTSALLGRLCSAVCLCSGACVCVCAACVMSVCSGMRFCITQRPASGVQCTICIILPSI